MTGTRRWSRQAIAITTITAIATVVAVVLAISPARGPEAEAEDPTPAVTAATERATTPAATAQTAAAPSPTAAATAQPSATATVTEPPPAPTLNTLGQVLDRGELRCGVKQTHPLFGFPGADGTLTGFDIEFCKAIAAAVLGDPDKVEYVNASDASTRFDLLAEEEFDVLIRTTTITASRDRELRVDFAKPILYTGQGFAVRKDSGINSTSDMGDAIICVHGGTEQEQIVADHFTDIGLHYDPRSSLIQDLTESFYSGRCDVLTLDTSDLAAIISSFRDDADDYKILPQIIWKDPLAPVVRENDSEWLDVVNWVVHGLLRAEEIGITRANVDQMAANPPSAEVARLLGVSYLGGEVRTLGFDRIDPQFIQRAIAAVGNYGEIYSRTIGDYLPRACTLNDLVINNDGCQPGQGGIMYSFPYR